jgi:hypothetical protein
MLGPEERDFSKLMRPEVSDEVLTELLADSAGFGADQIDKQAAGERLFSRVWNANKVAVCKNPLVRAYTGDPSTSDAVGMAAHVLGLMAVVHGLNMALIAALAVRIGLRELCKGVCEESPDGA